MTAVSRIASMGAVWWPSLHRGFASWAVQRLAGAGSTRPLPAIRTRSRSPMATRAIAAIRAAEALDSAITAGLRIRRGIGAGGTRAVGPCLGGRDDRSPTELLPQAQQRLLHHVRCPAGVDPKRSA